MLTISSSTLFKALSDPTRVKIMLLLQQETELCVCELIEAINVPQPKISRHLALLRELKIVTDNKQGQWIFYQLSSELPTWVEQLLQLTAIGDPQAIAAEQQRLARMQTRPKREVSKAC